MLIPVFIKHGFILVLFQTQLVVCACGEDEAMGEEGGAGAGGGGVAVPEERCR